MSVRRRSNGLTAESYVLLLDVDPRLAESLLVALASANVAAYTTPSTGRTGPFLELHLPTRPLEAVHVDSTRRPAARRVLEKTMPDVTVGLPSVDEEDQFAALIAGWDAEPEVHDWPAVEDLEESTNRDSTDLDAGTAGPPLRRKTDQRPPAAADPEAESGPPPGEEVATPEQHTDAPPSGPSLEKPAEPAPESPPQDEPPRAEDHYVPPPLPPLPPSHPVTKWGLVALGLGLLLLIFPTLLGLEHTTPVDFVGVLCIIGAVGLLVSRLSSRSTDEYDGPDDGAVV
jgi:hypothetical protein